MGQESPALSIVKSHTLFDAAGSRQKPKRTVKRKIKNHLKALLFNAVKQLKIFLVFAHKFITLVDKNLGYVGIKFKEIRGTGIGQIRDGRLRISQAQIADDRRGKQNIPDTVRINDQNFLKS